MNRNELDAMLAGLGLSQTEAARLLSVDARTVRRWVENPTCMPGPAEQALRAWFALHLMGLPWSPDSVDLAQLDPVQIAIHRAHTIDLEAIIEKVANRGGPAAPWQVDLAQYRTKLGPLEVSFYRLPNGGFAPQSYRRKDGPADLQRDWPLIEDAFAHIAKAIAHERQRQNNALGPSA